MSSTRILISPVIQGVPAAQQNMGNFAYGAAGIAETLQLASGTASSVLNTLPLFSMIFDEVWSMHLLK